MKDIYISRPNNSTTMQDISQIKILAIDLAYSGPTGYAIIDEEYNILDVNVFQPEKPKNRTKTFEIATICFQLYSWLIGVVIPHQPTHIVYEYTDWNHDNVGRNVSAVRALSRAEASLLIAYMLLSETAREHETSIEAIGANEVKNRFGKTNKKEIAFLLPHDFEQLVFDDKHAYFGNRKLSYDETDALAIGMVYLRMLKMRMMIDSAISKKG